MRQTCVQRKGEMTMRKRILAVILCAVMILSMTACGKSGGTSNGGSTSYKDEIHIAYNAEPETFDPVHGTATVSYTHLTLPTKA